jgi:hypothetical protein
MEVWAQTMAMFGGREVFDYEEWKLIGEDSEPHLID